jgi:integration host factor subunit beta
VGQRPEQRRIVHGRWVGFFTRIEERSIRMATVTKKELIDRISAVGEYKRVVVKSIIQDFLDAIVDELGNGNRLEFRDFGVFESKIRAAREAQNPKTMAKVPVPAKRTVKFKIGRVMQSRLDETPAHIDEATGLAVEASASLAARGSAKGDGVARPRVW